MKQNSVRRLVIAAMCLALGIALPFLTGQIPEIGNKLSPMHIPVLLCGFLCGWKYGLIVGLLLPLLRSFLFSMPPLMPTAVAMAFELGTYGFASGLLYRLLPKKPIFVYVTLLIAMLAGRAVWGLVSYPIYALCGKTFSLELFLANAFVNAVPGIILHIVIIPPVVLALKRAGLLKEA